VEPLIPIVVSFCFGLHVCCAKAEADRNRVKVTRRELRDRFVLVPWRSFASWVPRETRSFIFLSVIHSFCSLHQDNEPSHQFLALAKFRTAQVRPGLCSFPIQTFPIPSLQNLINWRKETWSEWMCLYLRNRCIMDSSIWKCKTRQRFSLPFFWPTLVNVDDYVFLLWLLKCLLRKKNPKPSGHGGIRQSGL